MHASQAVQAEEEVVDNCGFCKLFHRHPFLRCSMHVVVICMDTSKQARTNDGNSCHDIIVDIIPQQKLNTTLILAYYIDSHSLFIPLLEPASLF